MKKYWYKLFIYECPVCGSGNTYRERVYSDKPVEPSQRYEFIESYDWCLER